MKQKIEDMTKKWKQSEVRELAWARWAWPLGICALGLAVGGICLGAPVPVDIKIPGIIGVLVLHGGLAGLVSSVIDRRLGRVPRQ